MSDSTTTVLGSVRVNVYRENEPPVFTELVLEVPAGGERRAGLEAAVRDPDAGDTQVFSNLTGGAEGIDGIVDGAAFTVRAADTAKGAEAVFKLSVNDGNGGTAEGTIRVRVTASDRPPPVAVDDETSTNEEQPVSVRVLDNDVDPLGRGLTLLGVEQRNDGEATTDGNALTFTPPRGFFGSTTVVYQIVDATNDDSRRSSATVRIDVRGRPSAPGTPVGVRESKAVALTWGPASPNGAPVISYRVEVEGAGSKEVPSTSLTYDGLTNGTAYRFRVLATNEAGDGPWSAWSESLTPDELPQEPEAPTPTFGDQFIDLVWAPAVTEGTIVTAYEVQVFPNDPVDPKPKAVTTTSLRWGGLVNGNAYQFRVRAQNDAGWSEWGPQSSAEVPAGVPLSLTAPTATRGDRQAVVRWTPPDENGADISAYELQVAESGSPVRTIPVADIGLLQLTVTGLENGTPYTFSYRARNKAGWSAWGPASAVTTPAGVPLGATDVAAAANDRAATLTFSAPAANGSPITGYKVSINGGAFQTLPSDRVVRTLNNGTSYSFRVRACNDVDPVNCGGVSNTSNAVVPYGAPSAPNVTASVNSRTITWSWNTPNGNGRAITRFDVRLDGAIVQQSLATSFARTFGYAESHTVSVIAVNEAGLSSTADSASARTVDAPPPPQASVIISKGASVNNSQCSNSSCRRIRVSIANIAAPFNVECHESASPTLFYSYSTSSNPHENCFYGIPGRQVWVMVNGVRSNTLTW